MKKHITAALAIFLLTTLLWAGCGKPPVAEQLALGEQYLIDLAYEEALAVYLNVIAIEPKNPAGYAGAAKSYAGLGDTSAAKDILQQGLDETQSEDLRELLRQMQLDVLLSEEQLAFLQPLEAALLAYDMDTAFPILQSSQFQQLCRSLPKQHGNVYKNDASGEWMLVYTLQTEVDGENFGLTVVDSWENGTRLFAEAYLRNGKMDGGSMLTYDVVDGKVSDKFYNAIGVEMTENGFSTYRYEPDT